MKGFEQRRNVKGGRSERKKMLTGEKYNILDAELEADRQEAKRLMHLYNTTGTEKERQALLSQVLFWGRRDHTLPFRLNRRVRELIPGVTFNAVQDAGHTPNFEHPQIFNPLLVEFFGRE